MVAVGDGGKHGQHVVAEIERRDVHNERGTVSTRCDGGADSSDTTRVKYAGQCLCNSAALGKDGERPSDERNKADRRR